MTKRLAIAFCLLTGSASHAGQLGSDVLWISERTPPGELALNNDDYQGSFEDSPNHFKLNQKGPCCPGPDVRQSIVSTERLIPTRPSGGVTEYAISIGGSYSQDDGPGLLDSAFLVQLGFGAGSNFVSAAQIAPQLVFDNPGDVSPAIPDYKASLPGPIPTLTLIDHRGDALLYQGSSSTGLWIIDNFAGEEVFKVPLDIPDLPESVREFYSSEELQSLSAGDLPFTIRVIPVPEPSAALLASLAALLAMLPSWRAFGWGPGVGPRFSLFAVRMRTVGSRTNPMTEARAVGIGTIDQIKIGSHLKNASLRSKVRALATNSFLITQTK